MQQSIETAQVGGRILMIGVLSGFEQQIAIPNIFGTRREALTAPCPGRGGSLSGTQNCENNPMQSRNGPHTSKAVRAPAPDVTGKPHMAKIAQLFSMCSQELMMGIRRGR